MVDLEQTGLEFKSRLQEENGSEQETALDSSSANGPGPRVHFARSVFKFPAFEFDVNKCVSRCLAKPLWCTYTQIETSPLLT